MREATSSAAMDKPGEVTDLEARARRVETPCGDGVIIWRIWGEGDPLVLGHGAQGDWTHWIRNIAALAEDRMVIVPDIPGNGESAMPPTADHAGTSAMLAAGLKQILGDRLPADLMGFSFGGVCLCQLAGRHPEVARRVIIIGSGGLDTPIGTLDIASIRGLEGEVRQQRLKANLLGLMLHNEDSVDDFAIWQLVTNSRK
ncbi:MAG: alpha/beta fold hydrolase, partial [Sphingomonadaceae bacterium]|nr:alpha/beta fold hydrolase [Sphingomonadaceae bacterium]